MVNPELIKAARKLSPRRILVTGGSGFVGSNLARALAAAGHDVVATGRNPYQVPFDENGPKFERGDLRDSARMAELCNGCDLVYHTGALATPWGCSDSFAAVNVQGTKNIVAACIAHGVSRLVHVSSTAVHFDFHPTTEIKESSALASPFACDYARSKSEAESVVRTVAEEELSAVIIRARAVFGQGDNNLLPRLLKAADQKRLRQIGADDTRLDLTYIDNLILALILATTCGEAGHAYAITNDEPVTLWPFIRQVLSKTGRSENLRRTPRPIALKVAGMIEHWYRWRGKNTEPPITRYTAGLISTTKTFDISAAKRELGYAPIVSMTDATQRTIEALNRKDDTEAATKVGLRLFTTGYTTAKAHHAERGAERKKTIRFHAMIAVIDHPIHGMTLFDTGYSPRFFESTRRWPYRLYRATTPVVTEKRLSAVEILKENGIDPCSIRRIVLSHFHADHTCGLIDFPGVDIIATKRCWLDVQKRVGMGAIKRAFLPDLMPSDIEDRLCLIDQFHGAGLGPFSTSHDLFADGSVRLFDLPGHASGQVGLLVQRKDQDRAFLAADSVWTSRTIRENLKPTLPFRLLADSIAEVTESQRRLHKLGKQYPDIEIIPTHCPEVATRYGFDQFVDQVIGKQESHSETGE